MKKIVTLLILLLVGCTEGSALLAPFEDERNLSLEEKVKRYDLYLKVKDAKDEMMMEVNGQDITQEDAYKLI